MIPSKYQKAFFEKIEKGSERKIVLRAVPGSGKTTTLIEGSKRINAKHKIFLAYSKSVVAELRKKLPEEVGVKTVHSLGGYAVWKHLGRKELTVDNNKYKGICEERIFDLMREGIIQGNGKLDYKEIVEELETLVKYVRVTLADFRDAATVERMIAHFSLDAPNREVLIPEIPRVLEEGMRIARLRLIIDNTDQIWLPSNKAWDIPMFKYDAIFVDEAQDLSECSLALIERISSKKSLVCFAGDPQQSIMGFSGARSDAIKQIIKRFDAIVMPLLICYRCGKAIVEEAKKFVPEMEAAPGALEGSVQEVLVENVSSIVKSGDFVTCRTIAPLINLCLQLIAQGKRAVVVGEKVEDFLIEVVEDLEKMKGFNLHQFNNFLEAYKTRKTASFTEQKLNNRVIEEYEDRLSAAQACYQRLVQARGVQTTKQLKQEIRKLFSDKEADIRLFTIHKIKGLEADRVVILDYDKLPLSWEGQKQWEEDQEKHTLFVAITRAREVLIRARQRMAYDLVAF